MKDSNGREARLGNRVKLWENFYGRVVCSFDDEQFSEEYPRSDWGYLKKGMLILTDSGELFHYAESDEDFEVI